jgi:hypothetical protein
MKRSTHQRVLRIVVACLIIVTLAVPALVMVSSAAGIADSGVVVAKIFNHNARAVLNDPTCPNTSGGGSGC